MKINVCTGYPLDSPRGNTTTAFRIAERLKMAGHQATAMHTDTPPAADAQISLHALKTAAASAYFAKHQSGRLFIRLTGTDINGGITRNPELSQQTIDLADKLVVTHPACLPQITDRWLSKTVVIYPSVTMPELATISYPTSPLFTCVGHLRPVKAPHLMYTAIQKIRQTDLVAASIGNAYDTTDGQQARLNTRQDARYHWHTDCDRATALAWMKASLATINSSLSEGGANTVMEAIQLRVPVLATDIPGNRGFLGDDYDGYFETGRADQLAGLMRRCLEDPDFVERLKTQIDGQRPLFSAQRESKQLSKLVSENAGVITARSRHG